MLRGVGWALAISMVAACGDDSTVDDAGVDSNVDASDVGADAALVCPASTTPGCQNACQELYDCVATSSIADVIAPVIVRLGFSGESFSDCSPCVTRCEADFVEGADERVLACLETRMEMRSCAGSAADPTVVVDALNTCCVGEIESSWCLNACIAAQANTGVADTLTVCGENLATPVAPSCAGPCPSRTGFAIGIDLGDDSDFVLRSADVDALGRIALTGTFRGSVDFGGGALVSPDVSQVLAVYEADGTHAWSIELSDGAEGSGNELGNNVMFDGDGNVVALMDLFAPTDFGEGVLSPAGERDVVLASWSRDGLLRWTQQGSGPGTNTAQEIDILGSDVWIIGTLSESIDWGGGALVSAGMLDAFVARFDLDGNHQWSRRLGGPGDDFGFAVAAHPAGDYTIVSMAADGVDLGAGPHSTIGMQTDWYIARFADDGALRWVELVGVGAGAFGYRAEADGDAVFAQTFLGGMEETTTDYQGTTLTSPNQVTSRLDPSGNATWIFENRIGAMGNLVVRDLEVEPGGELVISSSLTGTLDLGAGPLSEAGGNDVMITRFDASQTALWGMRVGGYFGETVATSDRVSSGALVVVGSFTRVLDIGPEVLEAPAKDVFVIRFEAE